MSDAKLLFVDVYPIRFSSEQLEVLVLRRRAGTRCAGAWEVVHGRIEPTETPVDGAVRELREETGFAPGRLYNLSRVESFYLHRTGEVALVPAFVAVIDSPAEPVLSNEHDAAEWLPPRDAATRLAWPRERRALEDIAVLLTSRGAGPLEEVLRVR